MALPLATPDTLAPITCGECGIRFAVPEPWRAEKQRTGDGWYCPNGHRRAYGESDEAIAEKALAEEKERHAKTLARLNEAEAAERKTKAELSRVNKRIGAGVCPCCGRTFSAARSAYEKQTPRP